MKTKTLAVCTLSVSISFLVYFGSIQAVRYYETTPQQTSSNDTKITVEIKRGTAGKSVIRLLHSNGIIDHPTLFYLLWRLKYDQKTFKAGEYCFDAHERPAAILEKLIHGHAVLHSLTIPEGLTLKEIEARITQRFSVNHQELHSVILDVSLLDEFSIQTQSLEGFLFPDTYHFPRTTDALTIIKTMIVRFFKVFTEKHKRKSEEMGFSSMQIVTLASMIEKEAAIPEERSLISAVYHNRLKIGMRLQCDPTVIFALPSFNGNLTRNDLDYDSPYNTYRYSGLPPGPICSPGLGALEAALSPADVSYLYFVAKGDLSGYHVFSKTLVEHNKAVYQEQILERRKRKRLAK